MTKYITDNSGITNLMDSEDIEYLRNGMFDDFAFEPMLVTGSEILCRECKEWSKAKDWEYCEPSCSDCGKHVGIKCPLCREEYDHVWGANTPFKSRVAVKDEC